jgi:hypothetical protein
MAALAVPEKAAVTGAAVAVLEEVRDAVEEATAMAALAVPEKAAVTGAAVAVLEEVRDAVEEAAAMAEASGCRPRTRAFRKTSASLGLGSETSPRPTLSQIEFSDASQRQSWQSCLEMYANQVCWCLQQTRA